MKKELKNEIVNKQDFDFSSLPNYMNSLQKKFDLDDDERAMIFWVIEMYDKKRFINPCFTL